MLPIEQIRKFSDEREKVRVPQGVMRGTNHLIFPLSSSEFRLWDYFVFGCPVAVNKSTLRPREIDFSVTASDSMVGSARSLARFVKARKIVNYQNQHLQHFFSMENK